jgi:hypothetical protein
MAKLLLATMDMTAGLSDADHSVRAREMAARATSKHGYPADRAIIHSTDVARSAEAVIGRIRAAAAVVEQRSQRGDVSLQLRSGARVHVLVVVAPGNDPQLGHGGFSLAFGPLTPMETCPGFEGQIRVDHIDTARSRVVAQGRYTESAIRPLVDDDQARATAELTLRQIVGFITAGCDDGES